MPSVAVIGVLIGHSVGDSSRLAQRDLPNSLGRVARAKSSADLTRDIYRLELWRKRHLARSNWKGTAARKDPPILKSLRSNYGEYPR